MVADVLYCFVSCTSKLSPQNLHHIVPVAKIQPFLSTASKFSDAFLFVLLLIYFVRCFHQNDRRVHLVLATPPVHFLLRTMHRSRSRSRCLRARAAGSKSRARPHPRVHPDPPRDVRHPCTHCHRTFVNEWALRQHLRDIHGVPLVQRRALLLYLMYPHVLLMISVFLGLVYLV